MRFEEIINKSVIIVIISAIVAASVGYVVSMYAFKDSMVRTRMETQSVLIHETRQTAIFEEKIKMLTNRLEKLENEIEQSRILIRSLDSNVQLQMNLIKETLSAKKEGKE